MGINGLLALIILIADIWAIVNLVQSRVSTEKKVLWIVGIIIFPLIGFVIWFFAGPKSDKVS